jgi:hypothetical protein
MKPRFKIFISKKLDYRFSLSISSDYFFIENSINKASPYLVL